MTLQPVHGHFQLFSRAMFVINPLNEEGECLEHVPSGSSSPASGTVFTLPRAEQTRFEAAQAKANTSSRVFQRHASRADLHLSDPARHAFSTAYYMIALFIAFAAP
jgi:hypothetical protein